MYRYLIFSLLMLGSLMPNNKILAQELNCTVSINSSAVTSAQGGNERIFQGMRQAITNFVNDRRWTEETYKNQEKIDCSINIILDANSSPNANQYMGEVVIQVSRPIYNASLNTTILTYNDINVSFSYNESQPIEFNEGSFVSSLSSLLAYYSYVFIGLDHDTFELNGGTPYYQKAQQIINLAQNSDNGNPGWNGFSGNLVRNRYWLINNLLDNSLEGIRKSIYNYHRQGMDNLHGNADKGRQKITASLQDMQLTNRNSPSSMVLQVFMNTKRDELVKIYSAATPTEKQQVVPLLQEIDPANSIRYDRIMQN